MKHVIIGTAGHVDHGKTELVKALTGVDTDRLAEEKRRGITIEPGFARLDFSDGGSASIVDVPGHERFIKNMLAGAGGVDLAMLIVAADEGFMPQTVEHLDILGLLGVKSGLVVITKTDLADDEWLRMLEEDIKARVRGTFLEGKPVLRTSARTGEGIEALREALHELALHTAEKSARAPFRLPIDRVFSVDGFGTVVTGTLIDGCIAAGEEAALLPRAQFTGAWARCGGSLCRAARGGQSVGHQKRKRLPRRCAVCAGFAALDANARRKIAEFARFPASDRERGAPAPLPRRGRVPCAGGAAGLRCASSRRELLCAAAPE